jgi:hypothetical protein
VLLLEGSGKLGGEKGQKRRVSETAGWAADGGKVMASKMAGKPAEFRAVHNEWNVACKVWTQNKTLWTICP